VRIALIASCIVGLGCGSTTPDAADGGVETSLLDDPLGELPERLSQVGLYLAMDTRTAASAAHPYRPAWELWSSGSHKVRHVVLPAPIDNADSDAWTFPLGTLLFKTFSYGDLEGDDRPVETRLIRLTEEGWEYAVYAWDPLGDEAHLLPSQRAPLPVGVVDADGHEFEHMIPSTLQCRTCHEAGTSVVLGLSELQLNALFDGDVTQLEAFADAGLLASGLPEDPDRVVHEDLRTKQVLGYLEGNCTHCHNGLPGESNSFDLRHPVALDNLIDQPTESSASGSGIRVVSGDPDASIMVQAMLVDGVTGGLMPMPPLGVDRRDDDAIELIRLWITELAPP
jgi:hypothetical protein